MRPTLERLKQRKVVEWALAYLASAWLLMQLIDVIGGRWPIPLGVQRGIDLLLLVGFFLTLTLAWYHGDRGYQKVSGTELVIIAALFFIAGTLLTFLPDERRAETGSKVGAVPSVTDLDVPAIAVLPFRNLSGNSEQDYFIAGMHEALINALSHIHGLRVISRTSVMRYADTTHTVPEIAAQLNTDSLIEGSVYTSADRVRINVNLIDGNSDTHLWGAEYDRKLEDVLVLFSQIAETVAARVEVSLTPESSGMLRAAKPINPQLHDLYMRGRHALGSFTQSGTKQSIAYFEQAVRLDENYALGWAGLSSAYMFSAYLGYSPPGESMDQAEQAAQKALRLDSRLSSAHTALGWVRLLRFEWEDAREIFDTALRLNPNDVDALHGLGDYLTVIDQPASGMEYVRRARASDPFSPIWGHSVLAHLNMMNRFEAVLTESQTLLDTFPSPAVWIIRGGALWQLGRRDEALREFMQGYANRPDRLAQLEEGYAEGGPIGAIVAIAEAIAEEAQAAGTARLGVAIWFARTGDVERTLHWLERAYELQAPDIIYIGVRPEFEFLHGEPRLQALLDLMQLDVVE